MTTFPGSPRLLKGAIVGFELLSPLPKVIPFQYNPVSLTRSLEVQATGEEGDFTEPFRLRGAPVESITLDVKLDATDALEKGEPLATSTGIYPQLSALETLIYPKSALIIANQILLSVGTIQVAPPQAPFTLLIWGVQRVLPVRITTFSITEEAYDVNLNPIRATVSLGLRVLSYNDLSITNPGYHLFLAHQIIKETTARLGQLNDLADVAGGNLNVL